MPTAAPPRTRRDRVTADTSGPQEAFNRAFQESFGALGTFSHLTRNLAMLSLTSAAEALRLSIQTQEAAIERFRSMFGPGVLAGVPVESWPWWQGWGIGTLESYAEMFQRRTVETEIDVREPQSPSPQPRSKARVSARNAD